MRWMLWLVACTGAPVEEEAPLGPVDLVVTGLETLVSGCAKQDDGTTDCFGGGGALPVGSHAGVEDLSTRCVLAGGRVDCGPTDVDATALGGAPVRVTDGPTVVLASGSVAWNPRQLGPERFYDWSFPGNPAVDVFDSGSTGFCALFEDGGLWCTESDYGDGYGGFQDAPVRVAEGVQTMSDDGPCWLAADGGSCAGVPFDGSGIRHLAGLDPACGLRDDGSVACWRPGEPAVEALLPGAAVGLDSDSLYAMCAVLDDGSLWCLRAMYPELGPLDDWVEVGPIGG
ncbi:MAG: hypothetical protein H6737_14205 [Alphaproteobacteria bacterium]|nr:hypothetical protein [Alphaproteobacteria bacterium]